MAERLPPLNAIRYFEAAARHLSLSRAAEELHVTHSAVSHQIKALEAWLGVALFRRQNRTVVLTEAGQVYLRPVREAFEKLAEGSRQLRLREGGGALTVSTLPSFASLWLVPRLRRFREAHPDIDVRISADSKLVDFEREDVDLGIRLGRGHYPGLRVDFLLSGTMTPVCSPKLLEGPTPLRTPSDLRHHNLLVDYEWRSDFWARHLTAAGIASESMPRVALSFNYSNLMVQAAIDGLGVALVPEALAADALAAGRLVRPFDFDLPTETNYYLVSPLTAANRPKVIAFRDWILAETKAG